MVLGPGTFINEAAGQINEQLTAQTKQAEAQAKQAEHVVTAAALGRGLNATAQALGRQASRITTARFEESLAAVALQYGLTATELSDELRLGARVDSSKPAARPSSASLPVPESQLALVRCG